MRVRLPLIAIAAVLLLSALAGASQAQVAPPGPAGGSSATVARSEPGSITPAAHAIVRQQFSSVAAGSRGVVLSRRNLTLLRAVPALGLFWRRGLLY